MLSSQRLVWIIAGATLAVGLQLGTVAAQQRIVVSGTVQWATSNRIQMMTDASISVSVDVLSLPQGSYPSLRGGERVRVVGVVAPERNRLLAESVELGEAGGAYWNLFPQAP
jgi:hypothetical protein